jgi:Inner membrane protein YgaP-like, transmembrane domain
MTRNEGTADRAIRAVLGIVLILLALGGTIAGVYLYWAAIVVGAVLLLTAATGFCPAYRLFGIRTCRA